MGETTKRGGLMKNRKKTVPSISPDELLEGMGVTPADNEEGLATAIPWKSQLAGQQTRALLQFERELRWMGDNPILFGPFALMANLQSAMLEHYLTGPLKHFAKLAVMTRKNPDMYGEVNAWIYKSYAHMLYNLCGNFMTDNHFDREKAQEIATTPDGQEYLKHTLEEFAFLENHYGSVGLTRLHAMKTLLKCFLVLITERPLTNGNLPFVHPSKVEGAPAMAFEDYLEECRQRFEKLYSHDAFDIREYSETATGGMIGYMPYEVVPGSSLHSVMLRHYPLPEGVSWNGKVLYLSSPLINKPEIFDLAHGKSVVEGMLNEGYEVYLLDPGEPGYEESKLGLDFYGKTVPDAYLDIIARRHPGSELYCMGYCMGGTLLLPYLARRAEERKAKGLRMDIKKVVLMATPVKFDDGETGMGGMRDIIRKYYDPNLMREFYGEVNVPPQAIQLGMNLIQPGVQYYMAGGFYERAHYPGALEDAAPFLYWLTHGTKFPERAHEEWITKVYLGNQIFSGTYCLPSSVKALDGKPVNMDALKEAGVVVFSYRGDRDVIAPTGSCVASEMWGAKDDGNIIVVRGGLNRTIEKHAGHIFVVSKTLLAEFLQLANTFFKD
jgi:poly(3-hydroxyalkanoate) synthetase